MRRLKLPPRGLSRQARLQADSRFQLLRLMREQPERSLRALAESLGMSAPGVAYHLRWMVSRGYLCRCADEQAKPGAKLRYRVTPAGLQVLPIWQRAYLKNLQHLEKEIALLRRDEALSGGDLSDDA